MPTNQQVTPSGAATNVTVTTAVPTDLVKIKNIRTKARSSVTRVQNALKTLMDDPNTTTEDLEDHLALLKQKEEALQKLDEKVLAIIPATDQALIDTEIDKAERIQDEITLLKAKVNRRISQQQAASSRASSVSGSSTTTLITTASSTPTQGNNAGAGANNANSGAQSAPPTSNPNTNNVIPGNQTTATISNPGTATTTSTNSGTNVMNIPQGFVIKAPSKLPTLEICKFTGDITQWTRFWSRFELAVSKENLSPMEKLSQLESHLSGEARNMLIGLHAADSSYEEAVKILKNRYDRADLVKHTHMQRLLNLEPVKDPNDVKALRRLFDSCEVNLRSLRSLGVDTSLSGYSVCPAIIKCLPDEIRLLYSLGRKNDGNWNIEKLIEFLREQLEGRETSVILGVSSQPEKEKPKPKQFKPSDDGQKFASATALQTNVNYRQNQGQNRASIYCIFCESENHSTTNCFKHSIEDKKKLILEQQRCYICVKRGHLASNCLSRYKNCKICNGRHNVAICHKNRSNQKSGDTRKEPHKEQERGVSTLSVTSPQIELGSVLLQTVKATAQNPEKIGKELGVRILLDGGAQATFIREEVAQKLELPIVGEQAVTVYNFANKTPSVEKRKVVRINIQSAVEPCKKVEIIAIVLPYLCEAIATTEFKEVEKLMDKKGYKLCDPPSQAKLGETNVEILVGGDYYWEIVTGQIERFSKNLVCLETKFGWVIQGPITTPSLKINNSVVRVGLVNLGKTSDMMKSLWELEALGIDGNPQVEPVDTKIMEKFKEDIEFKSGRYHVKFPWRVEKEVLSNNIAVATQRMKPLVKKFNLDSELYAEYKKVIEEQLELGIAEKVENPNLAENSVGTYYMPHQPVRKKERLTTKLRVVFDASSHIEGEPSLNDCLSSGANLNPDLLLLLLRFRKHTIAITADIEKAFLQVALAEEERDSVRFLWVKEKQGKIDENNFETLRMARVPFGITSSPFLLAGTIKVHIEKFKESHPQAVEILNQDLYVDDLTSGENSLKGAFELSKQVTEIVSKANMKLRKWQTNSNDLRELWKKENVVGNNSKLLFEGQAEPEKQKVLGLVWDPKTDTFSFDVNNLIETLQNVKETKRSVLSMVAQIFDPMGILAPYTIRAKILLQMLWVEKVKWDETIGEEMRKLFRNWYEEMNEIGKVEIDRCYFKESPQNISDVSLHCFCDASLQAYCAVIYLRYVINSTEIRVSLVNAKARVAPLKELTIPRLELMGCLIGARLVNFTKDAFNKEKFEIFMWTDSTIALHWIKTTANVWKPFVSNRVKELQTISEPKNWAHCPGGQNPADIPTRGSRVEELLKGKLWWEGPTWLKKDKSYWPTSNTHIDLKVNLDTVESEKRKTILVVRCEEKPSLFRIIDLNKFSSIDKTLRITAYLHRFIDHKFRKIQIKKGPIQASELTRAELAWIRATQEIEYNEEIKTLTVGSKIKNTSKIATLRPILDDQNVLRVGGRLEESNMSYATKHPIILDKRHTLAKLLMMRSHGEVCHSGVQDTITQARERYWVMSGRQLAKSVVSGCFLCKKYLAKAGDAPMANLPKERIEETPCFQTLGVDFAGPLYVKLDGKMQKSYVCLFTCAVSRAVHLELVSSLSTHEFILALSRMISRRGIPHIIYSDNGKTFKKADRDMKEIWKTIKDPEVQNFFGKKGIEWRFITERAAWHGGYWERLVRSTKTTLKKILGKAALTYTEMETMLIETEGVINSRPITYVFNEIGEPIPLTPSHLLIGKRVTSLPPQKVQTQNVPTTREEINKKQKYRLALAEKLWKRWKTEYLLELRSAHHVLLDKNKRETKKGDVVLIHEDNVKKHMWKLGLVKEVIIGRDGKIRSCIVKTSKGNEIRRPVQLLYSLEINE